MRKLTLDNKTAHRAVLRNLSSPFLAAIIRANLIYNCDNSIRLGESIRKLKFACTRVKRRFANLIVKCFRYCGAKSVFFVRDVNNLIIKKIKISRQRF